jgi:hypothetical protein
MRWTYLGTFGFVILGGDVVDVAHRVLVGAILLMGASRVVSSARLPFRLNRYICI